MPATSANRPKTSDGVRDVGQPDLGVLAEQAQRRRTSSSRSTPAARPSGMDDRMLQVEQDHHRGRDPRDGAAAATAGAPTAPSTRRPCPSAPASSPARDGRTSVSTSRHSSRLTGRSTSGALLSIVATTNGKCLLSFDVAAPHHSASMISFAGEHHVDERQEEHQRRHPVVLGRAARKIVLSRRPSSGSSTTRGTSRARLDHRSARRRRDRPVRAGSTPRPRARRRRARRRRSCASSRG